MTAWGSPIEVERRNRIRLATWAYAYEVLDDPIASDEAFDSLALAIRPEMATGHPRLDAYFAKEFSAATGMWVRRHPDIPGLLRTYRRIKENT
jgi:hypothetical protein